MSQFMIINGRPEGRPYAPKYFIQCFNPRLRVESRLRKVNAISRDCKVFHSMKLTLYFNKNTLQPWIGNCGVKSGFFLLNCRPRGFGGFGLLYCSSLFPSSPHES